jgi:fumarate hydratase subunit beta
MNVEPVGLQTPFTEELVSSLRAGTKVLISGRVYGARDAAHQRLVELISLNKELPVVFQNQVIYYVGPAPATAGHPIGPAGPTTSSRMDPYTIPLLQQGVRGLIGKGYRSLEVRSALTHYGAVYFGTIGGAAALLARHIRTSRIIAFEDLGPEALFEFEFVDFPAIVVNDVSGNEAYVRPMPESASS